MYDFIDIVNYRYVGQFIKSIKLNKIMKALHFQKSSMLRRVGTFLLFYFFLCRIFIKTSKGKYICFLPFKITSK